MKRSGSEWALDNCYRSHSTVTDTSLYDFGQATTMSRPSAVRRDIPRQSQSAIADGSLYNFGQLASMPRPSAVRRHTTSAVPLSTINMKQGDSQRVTTLPGFPGDGLLEFAMGDIPDRTSLWAGFVQHLQSLVDCAYRHDFVSIEYHVSGLSFYHACLD